MKNSGFLPFPLLLRNEIENKIKQKERMLENCRYRLKYYLQLISEAWNDLSYYFKSQKMSMTYLNLEHVPENFKINNIRYGALSSKLKEKKVQLKIDHSQQLIIAYNASIQIYKKKYIVLLQEINEQISDLRFECLKDEIREGRILSHTLEMGFINISKRLEQFDSEFQPFMLIAKP